MAKLNLSQAAKVTGRNRSTIWRHIKSGKLSSSRDVKGMPYIDTSELLRVYGELKESATARASKKQHLATHEIRQLSEAIELLRKEQSELKEKIAELTNRLTNKEMDEDTPPQQKQPEKSLNWPKEIKSLALRNPLMILIKIINLR